MQVNRLSLLVLHYLRSFRCLNQWSLQTLCRLHIFLHWEIENDSVSGWNCEWVNMNCRPTMLPCSWVSHMQCCYYYILLGLGHIIIYCNTHNIRREEEQACCMHLPFIKVCVYPHLDVFPRYLGCSEATASGQLYQVTWSRSPGPGGWGSQGPGRLVSSLLMTELCRPFITLALSELKAIRLSHGTPLSLLETGQNATKLLRQNVRL